MTYFESFCSFLSIPDLYNRKRKLAVLISDLLACYLVTLNAATKWSSLLFNAPKLQDLNGSMSPTCRSLCPALHDCHSHWLPGPNTSYRVFFSAKPELWLSVPKLSRSCIPRGWDGLLTQSTWPSCGLSSGHSPPPCWLLLQSCGNALETAGQQQRPDWHGQAVTFQVYWKD